MSWNMINEILGLAVTDDVFAQELIASPVETIEELGYQLTVEEQVALQLSISDKLSLFCQNLLRYLPDSDQ